MTKPVIVYVVTYRPKNPMRHSGFFETEHGFEVFDKLTIPLQKLSMMLLNDLAGRVVIYRCDCTYSMIRSILVVKKGKIVSLDERDRSLLRWREEMKGLLKDSKREPKPTKHARTRVAKRISSGEEAQTVKEV